MRGSPRALVACGLGLPVLACLAPPRTTPEPGALPSDEREQVEAGRFVERLIAEAESRQRAGDPEEARRLAERAVEESGVAGEPPRRAAAEAVLGHVLLDLGEWKGARSHLEAAIELARTHGLASLEATARSNLGNLEHLEGQLEPALAEYAAAEARAAQAGDARLAARVRVSALRARARLGGEDAGSSLSSAPGERDVAAAIQRIEALESPRARAGLALHASRSVLMALEGAATVPPPLAASVRALLDVATQAAAEAEDEAMAAEIAGARGRLAGIEGRGGEALRWTEEAIFLSRRVGSEVSRIRWHVQAAEWLRRAGDEEAALLQQAEAVRLLERHRPGLASELRSPDAEREARQGIRNVYLGYVDGLLRSARRAVDPESRSAVLSHARAVLEAYKAAELRDYFADECVDRYRRRIARVEDVSADTAVVYPIVLPDRLELLLFGPKGIVQHGVDVPRSKLRETTDELRSLLERRTTRQYLIPARLLYDWLVRPLEPLLDGVETLVFVPDDVLRTIPMAVLQDGDHFLIERFAIATTPGIELTDPRPVPAEDLEVLLGGLSTAREGFEALPDVATELSRIQALIGGELLLDEDFRSEAVTDRIAHRDLDIVHLATHARFDESSSSGFLLTFDGRLGLDDLAGALTGDRYRDEPVELLVLSACETASGDERAALGLSGIAIQAGARSAIGTLWSVTDEATANLLVAFYQALRVPGTSRADALRDAQLSLLRRGPYQHPAYWGAFLLLNSWL